jgi:hypothetical protein
MEFNMPKNLHAGQLREELKSFGITFLDSEEVILVDTATTMQIEISESDKAKATEIIKKHIGVNVPMTIEQKLASLGLNLNDLKDALTL